MEHIEAPNDADETPKKASYKSEDNEGKTTSTQAPTDQGAPSNTNPSQTGASSNAAANPLDMYFPRDDRYDFFPRSTEPISSLVLPEQRAYL